MARLLASSQGTGARDREPAASLSSSPQVPLSNLILHAEWVCSQSRVGRRTSAGWEKGWSQGDLASPPGCSGRLSFVSAAQSSHGSQACRAFTHVWVTNCCVLTPPCQVSVPTLRAGGCHSSRLPLCLLRAGSSLQHGPDAQRVGGTLTPCLEPKQLTRLSRSHHLIPAPKG